MMLKLEDVAAILDDITFLFYKSIIILRFMFQLLLVSLLLSKIITVFTSLYEQKLEFIHRKHRIKYRYDENTISFRKRTDLYTYKISTTSQDDLEQKSIFFIIEGFNHIALS